MFLAIFSMIATSANASYFYLGGQGGITFSKTAEKTISPTEQHNLGGYGFVGGGFVGYNFDFGCERFDFGVEGFIVGNTTKNHIFHRQNDAKVTIRSNYDWGFRALPGYQLYQCVEAHLIAGYVRGNFRIKDTGTYGTISKTFNSDGYQVGCGLTVDISNCMAFRFDTVFNGYCLQNNRGLTTTDLVNTYSVRANSLDSTLSLLFHF